MEAKFNWQKTGRTIGWAVGAVVVLGILSWSAMTGKCPFAFCKPAAPNATATDVPPQTIDAEAFWLTDFPAAQARAKQENKPLLLLFHGSDWCGWCIKLDKEVFSQPEFIDWAKQNAVLFSADFPQNIPQSAALEKQNSKLAEQYQVEGFPTAVLLSPDGREIARTGYQAGGATNYLKHLESLLK